MNYHKMFILMRKAQSRKFQQINWKIFIFWFRIQNVMLKRAQLLMFGCFRYSGSISREESHHKKVQFKEVDFFYFLQIYYNSYISSFFACNKFIISLCKAEEKNDVLTMWCEWELTLFHRLWFWLYIQIDVRDSPFFNFRTKKTQLKHES